MTNEKLLSVFINDLHPTTCCPFWDRADIRFANEDHKGCITLPNPCLTYKPTAQWRHGVVGTTGLRRDGTALVADICQQQGWECCDRTEEWVPIEQEIDRLASCAFNMLWYHESRGISGASSTVVAAERPVLLNNSHMFSHFKGAEDIYWDESGDPYVEAQRVMKDVEAGKAKLPLQTKEKFGWPRAARRMIEEWSALQ